MSNPENPMINPSDIRYVERLFLQCYWNLVCQALKRCDCDCSCPKTSTSTTVRDELMTPIYSVPQIIFLITGSAHCKYYCPFSAISGCTIGKIRSFIVIFVLSFSISYSLIRTILRMNREIGRTWKKWTLISA